MGRTSGLTWVCVVHFCTWVLQALPGFLQAEYFPFLCPRFTGPSFHGFDHFCGSCLDTLQPLQALSGGGDTDSTQQSNEELTNAGPERGEGLGGQGMSRAFHVRGSQSALKMARLSVDYDQMLWTFQDELLRDGSDFKCPI